MAWWRARVDALKARDDLALAALVQHRGGPDAVTYLAADPDRQAVWVASVEVIVEWEREAADRRPTD